MIMPLDKFMILAERQKSTASDKTLLKWFLENNGIIKEIDWVDELSGAGIGGTDRFMIYPRDPNVVRVEIPMFYREEPPQQDGLAFKIIARQKTAGVQIRYQKAVAYGDGI